MIDDDDKVGQARWEKKMTSKKFQGANQLVSLDFFLGKKVTYL